MTGMLRIFMMVFSIGLCIIFFIIHVPRPSRLITLPSWLTTGIFVETHKPGLQLDPEAKTFNLWAKDTKCGHFNTSFAVKGSLPARALVSYPGSGNTWIRW